MPNVRSNGSLGGRGCMPGVSAHGGVCPGWVCVCRGGGVFARVCVYVCVCVCVCVPGGVCMPGGLEIQMDVYMIVIWKNSIHKTNAVLFGVLFYCIVLLTLHLKT